MRDIAVAGGEVQEATNKDAADALIDTAGAEMTRVVIALSELPQTRGRPPSSLFPSSGRGESGGSGGCGGSI